MWERYERKQRIRINGNTQIISGNGLDAEAVLRAAPPKVSTRVTINRRNLNRLATTVVAPDAAHNLDAEDLCGILRFSNEVNEYIGLPETDSLILRSSYRRSGSRSEPALLVRGITKGEPEYEFLEEGKKTRIRHLSDFTGYLRPSTYLIIHDDNYELQMRGIHARTRELETGAELLFGTDCLQTRELEMEEKRKPSIRVNVSYRGAPSVYKISGLFTGLSDIVNDMFRTGIDFLQTDVRNIRLRNIDYQKAMQLVFNILRDEEALVEMHKTGQDMRGQHAVVESRLYINLPSGVGRRVQILDID